MDVRGGRKRRVHESDVRGGGGGEREEPGAFAPNRKTRPEYADPAVRPVHLTACSALVFLWSSQPSSA